MEPKRTKYDTNPLDGKIADRAEKSFASHPAPPTEEVRGGPTRDIGRTENEAARAHPEAEAPTRRIDGVTSYPSVFIPPQPTIGRRSRQTSTSINRPWARLPVSINRRRYRLIFQVDHIRSRDWGFLKSGRTCCLTSPGISER